MASAAADIRTSGEELDFLLEWQKPEDRKRFRVAGTVSLLLHGMGILALPFLPLATTSSFEATRVLLDAREATRLVAPLELTQKDPNRGVVGKEFELENLLPAPAIPPQVRAPSSTHAAARRYIPAPQVGSPSPVTPAPAVAEPPPLIAAAEASVLSDPVSGLGAPTMPPRILESEQPPKLAFETPRAAAAGRDLSGRGALTPPSSAVEDALRDVARGRAGGGLTVGDLGEGIGGLGSALDLPPSPSRTASALELLSDPQGVDFKPYLITVLSAVRRNWFAVIPESARLGRQGKVVIQFAIDRNGRVPKLVIVSPSGVEALDRAAVAGISASHPFPPLPAEYRGNQVRLQFVFLYNVKRN